MKTKSILLVLACILLILLPSSLMAQTAGTGAIRGTVTDASGAVIPNSTVTLTSAATGQARTVADRGGRDIQFPSAATRNL